MKNLFELRGKLDKKTTITVQLIGLFLILAAWQITAMTININAVFPSPLKVLYSFRDLYFEKFIVSEAAQSIKLNLYGYLQAIVICIPLGFLIGLIPLVREMVSKYVDAMRYIPLTAVTGLFIVWFGIEDAMKVEFLSFGIIVYLLPVVVQRTVEVDNIYQQTSYTLGATKWQQVKTVFFPGVLGKLSDDIRVLTAISWTYIIVAEMINQSGGVGAMIFKSSRQSRIDEVFAILIVIILIGFIQDKIFSWLDKMLFPYKHI